MGQKSNNSKDINGESYHTPTIATSQHNYASNVIERLIVEFIESDDELDKIAFMFIFFNI
jgi:hypothetical protein